VLGLEHGSSEEGPEHYEARDQKDKMTLYVFEQYKFSPYTVTRNFVFLAQVTYSCILVSNLTCTYMHKFSKCIIYLFFSIFIYE
jgi:hypothetical protein